ncbi:hypothetical protein E2C01_072063 [Portunus trituberculatus]|uniref:Uncharacterized protein n=1 Tax=Portunus trituberculatus TaxID=210409 RepID=A0A5B7I664_PORTR|nr:hypothetical protein [Portunus trituberculatus]
MAAGLFFTQTSCPVHLSSHHATINPSAQPSVRLCLILGCDV